MIKENILPDFQEFLRSSPPVPDKNIPYFAHWTTMIYTRVASKNILVYGVFWIK